MYNRYIPQSDGSYSRRHIPDQAKSPQHSRPHESERKSQPECIQKSIPPPQVHCPARDETGVFGFLRTLLPKDFDTGDLMIVLLLLLMAGDCQEDQNWAVLTLVLYLFL